MANLVEKENLRQEKMAKLVGKVSLKMGKCNQGKDLDGENLVPQEGYVCNSSSHMGYIYIIKP